MTEYPFIKCLHPVRITNPTTQEKLLVPCGRCQACVKHKCDVMSLKCKLESLSSKFCYFIGLSYNQNHVPRSFFYYDSTEDRYLLINKTPRLGKGLIVSRSDNTDEEIQLLVNKFNLKGCMPCLSKRDIQLFLKRLRKYICQYESKRLQIKISEVPKENTRIRYYIVGEYGNVHYRPHYHMLLWFENEEICTYLYKALRKAWTFGYIKFEKSLGKCANYAAGYVNSYCNLPRVLSTGEVKPFQLHSIRLGEEILRKQKDEIYDLHPRQFAKRSIPIDGINKSFFVWRTFTSFYFPRCRAYNSLTEHQRSYVYQIYNAARSWTKETDICKMSKIIAKEITEDIIFSELCSSYQNDRCKRYFENVWCGLPRKKNKVDEVEAFERAIYMDLRLSFHFLHFCCDSPNDIPRMLRKIDDYYLYHNSEQLKNQLHMQALFFDDKDYNPCCVELFYQEVTNRYDRIYHPNKFEKYKDTPIYNQFKSQTYDKWRESIKHKEQNDKNNIFATL